MKMRLYNKEEHCCYFWQGSRTYIFKGTDVYLRNDARNDHVSKCFKIINEGNNAKGNGWFNYFWAYFTGYIIVKCIKEKPLCLIFPRLGITI